MQMGLGLTLTQGHFGDDDDLSYVGQIIVNLLAFVSSKLNLSQTHYDMVNGEEVVAAEMFIRYGSRWFVRSESLPADMSLKAIGFDSRAIYIETSPIDGSAMMEFIVERNQIFSYDSSGGTIHNQKSSVVGRVSKLEKPRVGENELSPRVCWVIPFGPTLRDREQKLVRFIDQAFEAGVFLIEDEPAIDKVPTGEMELKQNMQMVQRLQIEQRPVLALQGVGQMDAAMRQTQVQRLLAIQQRVIRMTPDEMTKFAAEKLVELGERKVHQLFLFILAGHLRRAKPTLTWPQARELAHRVQNGAVRL